MSRVFYNLRNGESADRALPVMIHHIACLNDQARASTGHIMDVGATVEVTGAQLRHLDGYHDRTNDHVDALQEEVTTARADII